ncbi:PP2C family protein-serine/threonine phosphatase [Actomonas aquatica]|uniref:Protein phosphatase 2C domain-containing protein n=1 Tax=Actomonas aquatica TaxID=2866162 RepID=A0ABZ1C9J1_9BACT|nr:protein phosphatase 2C domain-containing protein [Opitutus sp. WL0086]WRQ88364.1 protein phosphatase 2C domain-containing protein [Opitutus sp. WL0086]
MPETPPIALRTAAITDIGRVRRQNEDRFLRDDEAGVYVVADGIGGLPGGAAAAQSCIDAIEAQLPAFASLKTAADLVPVLHEANQQVLDLGRRVSPGLGMGTTVVCTAIKGDRLFLAHVGDSRCYLVRNGEAQMLTEDHSLGNDLAKSGARPPMDFDEHQLSALTRCMGQPEPPEVDVAEETLRSGDILLLATDGVSRVIPDTELPGLLNGEEPLSQRLANLIEFVNDRGAPDNSTAVLIAVD